MELSTAISISDDFTPLVHICATMWHETEQEMGKLLNSIFRLDSDQSALRHLRFNNGIKEKKSYEFQAHIFFDDAMEPHSMEDTCYSVNTFVKQLIKAMNSVTHRSNGKCLKGSASVSTEVSAPVKLITPYGGRLQWTLPGGNQLHVHLKDKVYVRNKKRWSQVMCMHYHLIHHAYLHPANRTFLLHVDGDVDFKPNAFHVLLDLMDKDEKLGAVCGRTHPTGKGPFVWFQRFEYSLSHWMQKATEDVLGSVLCCPGCFSLLRGSAILQVLEALNKLPTKPKHYLLEDQGEDRWLTSLLIKSGWRVKYASSAECWTSAPETLPELFKQRRRWNPSGLFHTIDLIQNWRSFTKKNDRMSLAYVIYHLFVFIISLLASSVNLLILSGGLQAIIQSVLPLHFCMLINLVPVVILTMTFLLGSHRAQMILCKMLAILYSLMQLCIMGYSFYMAYEGGICAPVSIFLIGAPLLTILAGILHPREFVNVICAVVYFILNPCMYLVMVAYAYCNLHNISWGTREVKAPGAKPEVALLPADIDDNGNVNDGKDYPTWVYSEDLGCGAIQNLPTDEWMFFKNQLETSLKPLSSDPEMEKTVSEELKTLRNKTISAHYLINALFLSLVLTLEAFKERLSLKWFCSTAPEISPLGVITLCMIFFVALNFLGMVIHRLISIKRECRRYFTNRKKDVGGTKGFHSPDKEVHGVFNAGFDQSTHL